LQGNIRQSITEFNIYLGLMQGVVNQSSHLRNALLTGRCFRV